MQSVVEKYIHREKKRNADVPCAMLFRTLELLRESIIKQKWYICRRKKVVPIGEFPNGVSSETYTAAQPSL